MCNNPFLEEIERRGLVTTDGDPPCATFTVSDENIACLTIQTNESTETFGGIGGFGSSSSLIHGVNDSTVIVEGSTINEFGFVIQIRNCSGVGRVQYIFLHMFPMWVAKKIMLACIIGNVLRSVLEERIKRFPGAG